MFPERRELFTNRDFENSPRKLIMEHPCSTFEWLALFVYHMPVRSIGDCYCFRSAPDPNGKKSRVRKRCEGMKDLVLAAEHSAYLTILVSRVAAKIEQLSQRPGILLMKFLVPFARR